ncbi:snurportin-1-like [Salvia divinorum]|uniref:Snurportin-1 n=1 Tax=Salvia divinorum TaxID=28513 RepID=A0ABD1HJ06_SALDI
MAPPDPRRPFKRPAFSDQQKRRDISLQRQAQNRRDAQHQARCLALTTMSLQNDSAATPDPQYEHSDPDFEIEPEAAVKDRDFDVREAASLRGREARRWFAKQLMLPEWMIDVPDRLNSDWYVCARPAGKRCFVVSSNGVTVSRLRNGGLLHRFPSALPNGARSNNSNRSGQSYCILDCIFHEADQTYYVIDMVCWAGMSMFRTLVVYNCDQEGLKAAYTGPVSYLKDGLLFYNKHAHYESGNTPLVLVWKDENCSQYVLDTDSKGHIPDQQQVVLELLDDGRLATLDDPPVIFGCLDSDFIQKTGSQTGELLRFSINEGALYFKDGQLERADLNYLGKPNRARAFADSYSKVMFQYAARHSPLRIEHLLASIESSNHQETSTDADMLG